VPACGEAIEAHGVADEAAMDAEEQCRHGAGADQADGVVGDGGAQVSDDRREGLAQLGVGGGVIHVNFIH